MVSMKMTKYEHSCVVVEEAGRQLVIDPGRFSVSFRPSSVIDAVVVTHIHSDHFDPQTLKQIRAQNPHVKLYAPKQVKDEDESLEVDIAEPSKQVSVGPFKLAFFGGKHELYEGFENIGVLVNDAFYHPGDSYAKPGSPIKVLAAPASAPWLRVSEASAFIKDCSAAIVFPIHNSLLSEIGESIHYRILSEAAEECSSKWQVLGTGQSLTL